jgi:hypothetical protein
VASQASSAAASASNGQFNKLEPGVGRLLGILSLQSLPRRITLDFRDIFSDGFAFDSIGGSARVAKGVINTQDLQIQGPVGEDPDEGRGEHSGRDAEPAGAVEPALGETLAVGAMIANPAIGAAAWVAQKILKDPFGQMFAFEYAISGSWADPKVEKLQQQAAAKKEENPGNENPDRRGADGLRPGHRTEPARCRAPGRRGGGGRRPSWWRCRSTFPLISANETDKVRAREKEGAGPLQDFLREAAVRHQGLAGRRFDSAGGRHPGQGAQQLPGVRRRRPARGALRQDPPVRLQRGTEQYNESQTIEAGGGVAPSIPRSAGSGLSICYDLRFPELYRATPNPACWPPSTTPTCISSISRSEGWSLEEGIVKSGSFNIDRAWACAPSPARRPPSPIPTKSACRRSKSAAQATRAIAAQGGQSRVPLRRPVRRRRSTVRPIRSPRCPTPKGEAAGALESYARAEDSRVVAGDGAHRRRLRGGAGGAPTATWPPTCGRWCACRSR